MITHLYHYYTQKPKYMQCFLWGGFRGSSWQAHGKLMAKLWGRLWGRALGASGGAFFDLSVIHVEKSVIHVIFPTKRK